MERQLRHVQLEDIDEPEHEDIGQQFDNDDRARIALDERLAAEANANAGRVNSWKTKSTVGPKKAKSLAKRDQRRTYFEYVRQQAEEQKQRIRVEEEMFADLYAEEREERQLRIEEAKIQLEEMQKARRLEEEKVKTEINKKRTEINDKLRKNGYFEIKTDLDYEILAEKDDVFILENEEFAVLLNDKIVNAISEQLGTGEASFEKITDALNRVY